MKIDWQVVAYDNLDRHALYALLQLRQQVFVVEQRCAYLDADNWDCVAWHVLGWHNKTLAATARILPPGYHDWAEHSIGRVATAEGYRGRGLGKELARRSLDFLQNDLAVSAVRISAQTYLDSFYRGFGFRGVSDVYLEDGIPHREMLWLREPALTAP